MELVHSIGTTNWTKVAEGIAGRIGKQCRERWYKHLDPSIRKSKWTIEEDIEIVRLYCEYGSSWSKIAQVLSGRTDNQIKNRFYSNL